MVIEDSNPADAELLLPMLDRHINRYGCAPKQLAVDGGYASKDNLVKAKECGVEMWHFIRNADYASKRW